MSLLSEVQRVTRDAIACLLVPLSKIRQQVRERGMLCLAVGELMINPGRVF